MSLTLEKIAKLAEVSRSTVSRVINEHPSVRPEVRQRVWKVIHEHDYLPHPAARTLVTRRTNVIGLIIPETVNRLFTDPYFPQFTQGVAEICNQRGYYLVLSLMTVSTDRDTLYRRLFRGGQLDGAIVASATVDDPVMPRLQESHCPCVLVGHYPDYANMPWVDVDNVTGGQSATDYLISLGHKRVATITGPLKTGAGRDRLEGYRRALTRAGIAYDAALVAEGDFTERGGFCAMEQLIRAEPTAVFAASDAMAVGAIKALTLAGRRVPQDVSIVGFDDVPIATLVSPQLTTIQQPVVELGKAAAERLISLLDDGDSQVEFHLLPTRLVVRGSTREI